MDLKALTDGLFDAVTGYIARQLAPLQAKLDQIEQRAPVPGPVGPQGEKGDSGESIQGPAGPQGEKGEDGRDAMQIEILDGIDPYKRYHRGTYAAHRGSVVRAFRATDPLPEGGELEKTGWHIVVRGIADPIEDAKPEVIERIIRPIFERLMGCEISRAVEAAIPEIIIKAADLIPRPADGRDGLTPEAIECHQKADRIWEIVVRGGGRALSADIRLPAFLDRGVFASGKSYEAGDGVTFAGSYWIAQADTAEKPGEGHGWRLAVKRGRDGKDAPGRDHP